jgi:hypothetical protein
LLRGIFPLVNTIGSRRRANQMILIVISIP